jgi:hypothetical protein
MDVVQGLLTVSRTLVWASLATIDTHDRPRSRVVHPLWELDGDLPVGWVLTRRTPAKVAHVGHRPYASVSYWSDAQTTAVAECGIGWANSVSDRLRAWDLAASLPAPLGFDPSVMFDGGPCGDDFALLRLEPWQIQVRTVDDLLAGRRPWIWKRTGHAVAA